MMTLPHRLGAGHLLSHSLVLRIELFRGLELVATRGVIARLEHVLVHSHRHCLLSERVVLERDQRTIRCGKTLDANDGPKLGEIFLNLNRSGRRSSGGMD